MKLYGQYTGLKDKNAEEIYEGDIIQREEGHIFKIEYNEEYAQYVTRSNKDFVFDNEPLSDLEMKNIEVIGNIYDNPELLEKE